jgi:CHAT domain-containing protein
MLRFACHGFLDEYSPLDSALALAIPARPEEGQDNGLLQAWGISEQVRIDADLVVLSACDSALGKEVAGAAEVTRKGRNQQRQRPAVAGGPRPMKSRPRAVYQRFERRESVVV